MGGVRPRPAGDEGRSLARRLVEGRHNGLGVKARWQEVREVFGERSTSDEALKRLEAAIKGEDPINSPALVRCRRGDGPAPAKCDPRAWGMLVSDWLRPSRPGFSVRYRRMCEAAAAEGWAPIPARTAPCGRPSAAPPPMRYRPSRCRAATPATCWPGWSRSWRKPHGRRH
ncbi:MAG: DNA-binding domain-containing protein [Alkalilacustris sp.]